MYNSPLSIAQVSFQFCEFYEGDNRPRKRDKVVSQLALLPSNDREAKERQRRALREGTTKGSGRGEISLPTLGAQEVYGRQQRGILHTANEAGREEADNASIANECV